MVVRFVDVCEIVDHHSLNFVFIITINLYLVGKKVALGKVFP